MKTVLLRMAAVCGIVCLLVLSTTQCSKPEAPPADTAATDSITTNIEVSKRSLVSFHTIHRPGYITSGSIRINLDTFKVWGTVQSDSVQWTDTLIKSRTVIQIQKVAVRPGFPGVTAPTATTGITEQPTKISVVGGGPDVP